MNKLTKYIDFQSLKSSSGSKEQKHQDIIQRYSEMEKFIFLLRKENIKKKAKQP